MSMLPKLELTYVTETGFTANISTMGDTTHIMVNHFCYHIKQMPNGELRDVCQALLSKAKAKADADKSLDDAWNDAIEEMSTQTQAR